MSEQQFESKKEWRLFELFEVAIILKGLNGVIELVLGVTLLFFSNTVNSLVYALAQHELIDDPNDFFATHALSFLSGASASEHFGGLYLLSHGVMKVTIVGGLLRNKAWAYPAALTLMSLFVVYQLVRVARYHSVLLLALTLFDMVVMWLIWHEYRRLYPAISSTQ